MGKKRKQKALLSPVSSRFIFVFALFQFSGPDSYFLSLSLLRTALHYLNAWNRLRPRLLKSLEQAKLSGIVWTPIRYLTLHSREIGAARRSFVSLQISLLKSHVWTAQKPNWYGFRAGAKVIRYSIKMKIAVTERLLFLQILALI